MPTPLIPSTPSRLLAEQALSRAAGAPLLNGNAVELLIDAAAHYDAWLAAIRGAQQRVLLSSLYMGTGPHEEKLVETIRQRMEQQPHLRVNLLLDYLRGTRLVGAEGLSSVTALAPLMQPQSQSQSRAKSERERTRARA